MAFSRQFQEDPAKSYQLTRRHNLVAVITDGSAVLGLGDIGPEAGMQCPICFYRVNGFFPTILRFFAPFLSF